MKKDFKVYKIYKNGLILHIEEGENGAHLKAFGLQEKPYIGFENSFIHQVHLAGGNRYSSRGRKSFGASESAKAKICEFYEVKNNNNDEVIIVSKTENVKITTHFCFYNGIKAMRVFNEVENISNKTICLEEVSSFYLYPLAESKNGIYEDVYFWLPRNSWHVEAQWERKSLKEYGLYNGNCNESMKTVNIFNTGSWSTKEYLPMGCIENSKLGKVALWQIENNGSWSYELGETNNKLYLNAGGPNYKNNLWAKKLKPKQIFIGVASAVVFSENVECAFGEITKYRRAIRRENQDNVNIPIIYNSYMHCLWDYPTPSALKPLIKEASKMGVDYFCIDAGWHDEGLWWDTIGNWQISKRRFAEGLESTVDYVKQHGMKAGIWIEPECVGVNCSKIEELDDDCYFKRNGERVRVHDRYVLDFSNPKVIKRMNSIIKRLIDYGFEYIKMDYNIDGGVGTEVNADSVGDGLLNHNRAYIDWLKGLYQEYPDLVIESCASGGCRMDYAMLALNSVQSTSDQTNYLKYPYISANAITAVTPEQGAVWSYPLRGELSPEEYAECIEHNKELPRFDANKVLKSDIVINMVNCMLGRMHLASHLELLEDWQRDIIEEGIQYYRYMAKDKINALPYFPKGLAKWGDDFVASGLKTDKKVYLAVWNLGGGKQKELQINMPFMNLKIAYPKQSKIKLKQRENLLEFNFFEEIEACMIEFDIGGQD